MNNFEEKLNKIKVKKIGDETKESLWHSVMLAKIEREKSHNFLLINIFNLSMNKIIAGILGLVLIVGGGTAAAASNGAKPGDFLFPVDVALEKIQLRLAGEEKKSELKLRFAEERVKEIREVSEEKTVPVELIKDLSDANVTEIEADVFTNETVVKLEAQDRKYGYISQVKVKADLIKEIASKYSIPEGEVERLLDFEVEDRASRADDKGFLNKTHSVVFDEDEEDDVSEALNDIEELLGDDDGEEARELRNALRELLILLGDENDLEIRKDGNKIRIESESGDLKIRIENKGRESSDDSDDKDDDNDDSRGRDADRPRSDDDNKEDVKEDDSEVFCRGEWRDAEDCDDEDERDEDRSGNDDSDEDDEDRDDDKDEDEDDKDEDDDKDDKDDDKDDDNSGRGGGDDN